MNVNKKPTAEEKLVMTTSLVFYLEHHGHIDEAIVALFHTKDEISSIAQAAIISLNKKIKNRFKELSIMPEEKVLAIMEKAEQRLEELSEEYIKTI